VFTSTFAAFYQSFQKITRVPFEVLFASADRSEEDFVNYFSQMPWVAIPFDREREIAISSKFGVECIPKVIVLDPQGNVINEEGVSAVMNDPTGKDFPWVPRKYFFCCLQSLREPNENQPKEEIGLPQLSRPKVICLDDGKTITVPNSTQWHRFNLNESQTQYVKSKCSKLEELFVFILIVACKS
jgi:hypothetical protein